MCMLVYKSDPYSNFQDGRCVCTDKFALPNCSSTYRKYIYSKICVAYNNVFRKLYLLLAHVQVSCLLLTMFSILKYLLD